MSLKNRLNEDMKNAMRAKDTLTLSTIRLVNAAIKQFEVDTRETADDAQIQLILTKMMKQRKDSVRIYTDAKRTDLADRENAEIAILKKYLPEMLSESDILAEVETVLVQTGAKTPADMGKAMSVLQNRLTGKADMSEVSRILKQALAR